MQVALNAICSDSTCKGLSKMMNKLPRLQKIQQFAPQSRPPNKLAVRACSSTCSKRISERDPLEGLNSLRQVTWSFPGGVSLHKRYVIDGEVSRATRLATRYTIPQSTMLRMLPPPPPPAEKFWRGRVAMSGPGAGSSDEEEEDDDCCVRCRRNDIDADNEMLECDSCDAGWHMCIAATHCALLALQTPGG